MWRRLDKQRRRGELCVPIPHWNSVISYRISHNSPGTRSISPLHGHRVQPCPCSSHGCNGCTGESGRIGLQGESSIETGNESISLQLADHGSTGRWRKSVLCGCDYEQLDSDSPRIGWTREGSIKVPTVVLTSVDCGEMVPIIVGGVVTILGSTKCWLRMLLPYGLFTHVFSWQCWCTSCVAMIQWHTKQIEPSRREKKTFWVCHVLPIFNW